MKYIQALAGIVTAGKPTSIGNITGTDNISDADLAGHSVYPFIDNTNQPLPANMKATDSTTDTLANGVVTRTRDVVAMSPEEIVADKASALVEKLEAVRMIGRFKRAEIVADASPYEAASWSIKRAEAMAYDTARNEVPPTHSPGLAPMLAVEATVRGVTLDTIVDRVLANAAALSQAEAAIAGSEGKHSDSLKVLGTAAEIRDYDETAGWAL